MVFIFSFNLEREMDEQIDLYLDGIEGIREHEKEYLKNRYYAVHEHIAEIDELLDRTAKGWSTDRFASADLAILRVACYEMLFDEKIPEGVAINEAVEIAKIYGGYLYSWSGKQIYQGNVQTGYSPAGNSCPG